MYCLDRGGQGTSLIDYNNKALAGALRLLHAERAVERQRPGAAADEVEHQRRP